jgi:ubiquinone/menaquinone biosynthesis C-methylase UbiE
MKTNKSKLSQEEVWDEISKSWVEFRRTPKKAVREFLNKQEGKREIKILDLGCGSGRHFIKSKNLKFYGVDFSEKMLELAEKKNIAVELKKSKASLIPFKDDFFDAGVFAAALHCIDSKGEREKALKELFRVLKPGAEAIITVINKQHKRVKNKIKNNKK